LYQCAQQVSNERIFGIHSDRSQSIIDLPEKTCSVVTFIAVFFFKDDVREIFRRPYVINVAYDFASADDKLMISVVLSPLANYTDRSPPVNEASANYSG
jgi:hypothetical protein